MAEHKADIPGWPAVTVNKQVCKSVLPGGTCNICRTLRLVYIICRMSSSGHPCLLLFCLVDACDHQSQQEVKKVDKSTKIMCAHKKMCDFQFSSMSILYHGSNSLDHSLLTGERAMSALLWTFGMHPSCWILGSPQG